MRSEKKFALDVSHVFFAQIILLVSGLLVNVIIGRWLGPADLGLYSLTIAIYGIASMIGGLGIPQAITKFSSEFKEEPDKLKISFSIALINSCLIGLFIGALIFLLAGFISDIYKMPNLSDLLRLISLSIPLYIYNSSLLGLLNGLRKMDMYAVRSIIRSLAMVALITLFVWNQWGIKGAIYGILLSELLVFLLLLKEARKYFVFSPTGYKQYASEQLTFSIKIFFANFIYTLNTFIDTLIVGLLLTQADLGIYAIAIVIARVGFLTIPTSVSTITYPAIAEYFSKGMYSSVQTLIALSIKYNLIVLSFGGIFIIFFAEKILLLLLGSAFLRSTIPLIILIFCMIVFGSFQSIGSSFTAMNRPDVTIQVNIVILVINIVLNVLLIPPFGLIGAACATGGSFLLLTLIAFFQLKYIFNIKVGAKNFLKILFGVFAIIGSYWILKEIVNFYLLVPLLFIIFIGYIGRIVLDDVDWGYLHIILSKWMKIIHP